MLFGKYLRNYYEIDKLFSILSKKSILWYTCNLASLTFVIWLIKPSQIVQKQLMLNLELPLEQQKEEKLLQKKKLQFSQHQKWSFVPKILKQLFWGHKKFKKTFIWGVTGNIVTINFCVYLYCAATTVSY